MPPLLPGCEYDIFISYRHNDNRSGWVTDFVSALQEELAATIKEPLSIYFDKNPHDGLLETHNVDKSLEGKLKCLIFIPIISQTYCDPKSFAWQHEFCAFNKISKEDSIGRDVKLGNGNVASRILPIKIYDLDIEDKNLVEKEIGGALRSVDFIYKEPGVNRPLKLTDSRTDNQNKTDYRNQVNKVANATKEIIVSLKNSSVPKSGDAKMATQPTSGVSIKKLSIKTLAILSVSLVLTVVLIIIIARWIEARSEIDESLEKTIAVLPFVDMTPAKDMEYLGDGIAEEIINSLTHIKDLKVIGRTSSFQFKGEKIDLREVGQKLAVGVVLEGSIQKSENSYRITAQLIRTSDNVHVWSERFDLEQTNIFKIQDDIATAIVGKLQLTLSSLEQRQVQKKEINNEAYTLFLKGLFKYMAEEFQDCIDFELKAIAIDPTYAPAYAYIGLSKTWMAARTDRFDSTLLKEAIQYSKRSIELDPDIAEGYSALGLISWRLLWDYRSSKEYFDKSLELSPGASLIRNRYGYFLTWMGDLDKAANLASQTMKDDPAEISSYNILFYASLYSGKLDRAAKYLADNELLFGHVGEWRPVRQFRLLLDYAMENNEQLIDRIDSLSKSGASLNAQALSLYARALIKTNRNLEADSVLKKLKQMVEKNAGEAAFNTSLVFALRNELDSCFHYLSISARRKEEGIRTFKLEPLLKGLKHDARYVELYRQLGFDKY